MQSKLAPRPLSGCMFLVAMLLVAVDAAGMPGYLEVYPNPAPDCLFGVDQIVVDDAGVKWFANGCYEVFALDRDGWRSYSYASSGGQAKMVFDIAADRAGRVWVAGLWDKHILYLQDGEFHLVDLGEFLYYTALGFSDDGDMWITGFQTEVTEAFGRYRPGTGWLDLWVDFSPRSDGTRFVVAVDPEGRACTVGMDSVYRFTANASAPERLETGYGWHTDLAIGGDGDIWITSGPYGTNPIIHSQDGLTWSPVTSPDIPADITSSYRAKAIPGQGIWFLCNRADGSYGALWYDYARWRWFDVPEIEADIAVDQTTGDVWFGYVLNREGSYLVHKHGVAVLRGGPDAWPPVWIELEASAVEALCSDSFSLKGSAEFQMDLALDLYVVVQLPDGSLLYAPGWTPAMIPLARDLNVPIGLNLESFPLVELDAARVHEGTYRWYAACTYTGTMEFASNIASCEFSN